MCTNTTAILSYAAFAAQPKIWKIGEKRTKKNFFRLRRKLENNYLAADPGMGGGSRKGASVAVNVS